MVDSEANSKQNEKYEIVLPDEPLRQGEILTSLIQLKFDVDTIYSEEPEIDPIVHPYAIIVSQDCDLDWDHKARQSKTDKQKEIPNILFCEVTTLEKLAQFILELDSAKNLRKSRTWAKVRINKDERYHFLEKVNEESDALNSGLPELGVDFKRYFTIPAAEVYLRIQNEETQRRCKLKSPYLEHFTSRFYYFQSRVALPEDHYSEPVAKD